MKDFLTLLLIVLVCVFIIYWFGINRKWQFDLRNHFRARKLMRVMRKRLTRILGGIPIMCKDGKHVKLGKRIFSQDEFEQFYKERLLANGYVETEYGWEKKEQEDE